MSEFRMDACALDSELMQLYIAKTQLYTVRAELSVQILYLRTSGASTTLTAIKNNLARYSKKIGNEVQNINYIINSKNVIKSKASGADNQAANILTGIVDNQISVAKLVANVNWRGINVVPMSKNVIADFLKGSLYSLLAQWVYGLKDIITPIGDDAVESEYEIVDTLEDQKKLPTKYESYRQKVDAINGNEGTKVGWKQEYEYSGGLCTLSATTTLLRRKQVADGKAATFEFSDVYYKNGGYGVKDESSGKWPGCTFYQQNTYSKGDTTYSTVREAGNVSEERLRELLDSHPEGIVLYDGNKPHAIVITDYEMRADGSIQFYADDPVNDNISAAGRIPIQDTWLAKNYGDPIANSTSCWYIG